MNFYDHQTYYDQLKGEHPHHPDMKDAETFYKRTLASFQADYTLGDRHALTGHNQSYAEAIWHRLGRPYFKVFPNLLPMFMKTKLTVPGKFLHSPFESFLIRLSENHGCEELTIHGRELRSILVNEVPCENVIPTNSPIRYSHMFIVWLNFGETYKEFPYYVYQVMKFHDDQTIEEALIEQQDKIDLETMGFGAPITNTDVNHCIRLVVSTCFLATGADRIVEPDVLNKDLQAYIDAKKEQPEEQGQSERIERLHNRAKKRGKKGWTIGREISIPRHSSSDSDGESTGEHLIYQHQRGAHFHLFYYGPQKSQCKVQWIRQLTVRPDLPLPPVVKRGYKAT